MSGETYARRYGGGFVNGSGGGTPIDATFLNAVETALLYLLGEDPASNEVPVWTPASSRFVFQKITNAQIDAAAAIDKTKLGALSIVDADVSGAAAIAQSKLALDITNSQINAAAAIAISKLASYPSSAPKHLRGDGSWQTGGSVLLASQVLTGTQASFDTNTLLGGSIPGTYNHLRVVAIGRSDGAGSTYGAILRLNNDSTANYDYTYSWDRADGTASIGGAVATASPEIGSITGAGATASRSSHIVIDIPVYAGTTFSKTASGVSHIPSSTATTGVYNYANGVTWRSTSAITRLALIPSAGNWIAGSAFYVYGVY